MAKIKDKCTKCGGELTYDSALSVKKKNIRTLWCTNCPRIVTEKEFTIVLKNKHDKSVGMPVTSVRRYVFKGELPGSD